MTDEEFEKWTKLRDIIEIGVYRGVRTALVQFLTIVVILLFTVYACSHYYH